MVKLSFNSALGQKELKKEENDEALIPEEGDVEDGLRVRQHQTRAGCWCMCLGLALMLSGVVVGGAYLYRYYNPQEGDMYFCGVDYREEDFIMPVEHDGILEEFPLQLRRLEERVRILEEEEVELISVPVPEFGDSDAADIIHDFSKKLTAYLDLSLSKCYVIPLNTSVVMPPRDFMELLDNIKRRTYLPQSYLIQEQMVVTERVYRVDQLGQHIYGLCRERETYRLQRRDTILGIQKREAHTCHKIRHFENLFVMETVICEP